MTKQVIKRDGRIVPFDQNKITSAILKAMNAVSLIDEGNAKDCTLKVIAEIKDKNQISVEEIQDVVEINLIKFANPKVAKEFILYRAQQSGIREVKSTIGVEDELKLPVNALALLDGRYLKINAEGKKETPSQMFHRTAKHISNVEKRYGDSPAKWNKIFYNMLANQIFYPNMPCLSGDTIVRCCGGDKTIKELSELYEKDEKFEVFSVDSNNKVTIGMAYNPRLTRKNAEVYKVSFDDGSNLKVTGDHLIMLRDGTYARADSLVVNQSVMPFNYTYNNGYLIVYENINTLPKAAHKLVYEKCVDANGLKNTEVLHHVDFNKKNNNSKNLKKMDKLEHIVYHGQNARKTLVPAGIPTRFGNVPPWNEGLTKKEAPQMSNAGTKLGNKPWNVDVHINLRDAGKSKEELLDIYKKISNSLKNSDKNKTAAKHRGDKRRIYHEIIKTCPICGIDFETRNTPLDRQQIYCSNKCVNINRNRRKLAIYNHKVLSVDFAGYEDVYDLSVETYNNFAANNIFVHNCLSNAGVKGLNYLAACYVLSVNDSIDSIFSIAKDAANIFKSGGGLGLYFSNLRPRNDVVKTTGKVSSGVVGFLPVFNAVVESVKQGGMRRGACLGLLRCDHPDIIEYINCKKVEGNLSNFNLSVALTDRFMTCVARDSDFSLINPRNNEKWGSVRARYLLNLIAKNAWETGDPGIVFFDTSQKNNPTPSLGQTYKNACSETDLLDGEQCNLGSLNLTKFFYNGEISWVALSTAVYNSLHFLDDVIDATDYMLPRVKELSLANRKIGLGVMGFADLLYLMKIPYNSEEATEIADKLMEFIYLEAKKSSEKLAEERGSFPNLGVSIYTTPIRNASFTVIAPTGEISILANCSAGIEPNFGLVFKRQTTLAVKELIAINPIFEQIAKKEGFYSVELLDKIIQNNGSAKGLKEIPEEWQKIFVIAHEVSPEFHVRVQSKFQAHCDNSISKTVNLPNNATVSDVEKVIKLAYELGCNGITVFRDGCRKSQVMNVGENACPECKTNLVFSEGCYHCPSCGWGGCQI